MLNPSTWQKRSHLHFLTQRLTRQLYTRGLSPAAHRRLLRQVNGCSDCRRYFDQHAHLERAMTGAPAPLTHFSIERSAVTIARLATAGPEPPALGKWLWLPVFAAFSFLLLLDPGRAPIERWPLPPDSELEPVALVAKASGGKAASNVGIRVFRVRRGETLAPARVGLGLDDAITFTVTRTREAQPFGFLTLVGQQDDGQLRWYYPHPPEEPFFQIPGLGIDMPLGHGFALSPYHQAGPLRLHALFSPRPLNPEEVKAWTAAGAQDPFAWPGQPPLPQHTLLVQITAPKENGP